MISFYIITLLTLFILSLSEFIINKINKLLIYVLPVALLILIGGLRYGISSDYFHYKEMFYHINEKANWSNFFVEYGYLWLNLMFSKISNSFEFFIFFFCLISVSIKSNLIFKYCTYPFLGLILYFTFYFLLDDMGAIRRGFACAFVLAAFFASFNHKYITALLLLFIAINVHLSAIFCLPFIFINKYRSSIKLFILFLLLSFLLGYLFNNYYDKLIALNSDLLIYQKFIAYFDDGFEFESSVYEIGLFLRIILVLILLKNKSLYSKIVFFEKMLNLYIIGICVLIIFSKFTIFSSIVIYFKIFEIFLIPILISKTSSKKRVYVVSFFFIYAIVSLYKLTNSPFSDFQVYNSILSI